MSAVPMEPNARGVLDRALDRPKRWAFPPGEFVGQESFMGAHEILTLARAAGVRRGVAVLDVCAGVGGPGVYLTRHLACRYVGMDASAEAIDVARRRARGLDCEFLVGAVPPLPAGRFDVVMLLETMLAFPDKLALLTAVASVLSPAGRFAFTLEEGQPLSATEHLAMPRSETVHLVPLAAMHDLLERSGFVVRYEVELTRAHHEVAERLTRAYEARARGIGEAIGEAALTELLTSHRLWSQWLASGRARKFALVAQRR